MTERGRPGEWQDARVKKAALALAVLLVVAVSRAGLLRETAWHAMESACSLDGPDGQLHTDVWYLVVMVTPRVHLHLRRRHVRDQPLAVAKRPTMPPSAPSAHAADGSRTGHAPRDHRLVEANNTAPALALSLDYADVQAAEPDHAALRAEPDHAALRAEPDHAALRAEPDHAALRAEPDHAALRAEPDHAALRAEPDHAALRAEPDHAALRAEPDHAALRAEPDHAALRAEPDHAALRAEPDHAALRAEPDHADERALPLWLC